MSILSRGQWISLGITGLGAFVWLSSWYFKTQGELETATPAQHAVGQWADEYGSQKRERLARDRFRPSMA